MNKPVLYIHGGTHKTGTSSIQNFLAINSTELLNNSVLYPVTGRDELMQHHYFFSSIRSPEHPYFKPKKNFSEYLIDLQDEILLHKPQKVILSSEIFCKLNEQNIQKLKNNLGSLFSLFSKIKVIFYLRRPDLYGVSANNTSIWYGSEKEHKLTYDKILKWLEILNKEQIIFRPFEKEQFVGGNLYLDFLSIVEIANDKAFIFPSEILNESVDENILELCRIINNITPPISSNNLKSKLIEAFNSPKESINTFFSPHERLDLINQFEEDNQIIAKEFLGREDGILFYEPLPDLNDPWEPYKGLPIETVVKAFSYLLFKQQEQIDMQTQQINEIEKRLLELGKEIFLINQKKDD